MVTAPSSCYVCWVFFILSRSQSFILWLRNHQGKLGHSYIWQMDGFTSWLNWRVMNTRTSKHFQLLTRLYRYLKVCINMQKSIQIGLKNPKTFSSKAKKKNAFVYFSFNLRKYRQQLTATLLTLRNRITLLWMHSK